MPIALRMKNSRPNGDAAGDVRVESSRLSSITSASSPWSQRSLAPTWQMMEARLTQRSWVSAQVASSSLGALLATGPFQQ